MSTKQNYLRDAPALHPRFDRMTGIYVVGCKCSNCGKVEEINNNKRIPPAPITNSFRNKGWDVKSNARDAVCPNCKSKEDMSKNIDERISSAVSKGVLPNGIKIISSSNTIPEERVEKPTPRILPNISKNSESVSIEEEIKKHSNVWTKDLALSLSEEHGWALADIWKVAKRLNIDTVLNRRIKTLVSESWDFENHCWKNGMEDDSIAKDLKCSKSHIQNKRKEYGALTKRQIRNVKGDRSTSDRSTVTVSLKPGSGAATSIEARLSAMEDRLSNIEDLLLDMDGRVDEAERAAKALSALKELFK